MILWPFSPSLQELQEGTCYLESPHQSSTSPTSPVDRRPKRLLRVVGEPGEPDGAWACTCRAWGIGKLEAEVEPIFIRLRFRSRVLVQVGVNLVCQHGENIWENPFVNMFQSGKRTILNHINQFFQTLWHVCRVQTYYSQPLDLILPQKEWQTRCWCWICR